MAAITLVSHASVIMEVGGVRVLTDPWQFGKAFNGSWSLLSEPHRLDEELETIDYLWVSHEHPDHFHIPTLKSLPEAFRRRVTVLFQENHSGKMVKAFKDMLGFENVRVMPHRQFIELRSGVKAYCFHSRQIDSALALKGEGLTIFNVNDCELSKRDIADVKADLGRIDVILNQFSIAGFDGFEERLGEAGAAVIAKYVRDTVEFKAKYTIPFASYIYFCCSDNKFINKYVNTPRQSVEALSAIGRDSIVLRPGDRWTVPEPWDNSEPLRFYDAAFGSLEGRSYEVAPVIAFDKLQATFSKLSRHLQEKYGKIVLGRLKPVVVDVPDLGEKIRFDFISGRSERTLNEPTLRINSQPLDFCFSNPFGVQTLGVSGRYRLLSSDPNWARVRIICALNNAEIFLRMKYLLRPKLLRYFWSRRKGLTQQVIYRLRGVWADTTTKAAAPNSLFED